MGIERTTRDLSEALAAGSLVRLSRHHGWDPIDGVVVGLGPKWVLIAVEVDAGFAGYSAARLRDIRKVVARAAARFVREAIALEGHWPMPALEQSDLSSTRCLFTSLGSLFGLVTISYENARRDEVQVGAVDDARRKSFRLLEMTTEATWGPGRDRWRYRDITRLDVGGPYEPRLYAVAGPRPDVPVG